MQKELRVCPPHGFTTGSFVSKRFRENTSATALLLGLVLPTLQHLNEQLNAHINNDKNGDGSDAVEDLYFDEFVEMATRSATISAKAYGRRMARVSVQTAACCLFITSENPTLNKMVYLWDLYPRLHQRYVGEVLAALRFPRFVATLLGPLPYPADVAYLEGRATPASSFRDSILRCSVTLIGDVVVDTACILLDGQAKKESRGKLVCTAALQRITVLVGSASGAAIGRLALGDRGEYWGEHAGALCAAVIPLTRIVYNLGQRIQKDSNGSGNRQHRRKRQAASGPEPAMA